MRSRLLPPLAALLLLGVAACHTAPPYQGLTADALESLAQQKYREQDYDEAERALNRLFTAYPSFPRTPEARLLLADTYYADEQYITAEAEYRRFLDRFPQDPRASRAALGICRSAVAQSPAVQRDQSPTEDAVTVCGNAAADYANTPEGAEAGKLAKEMREKLAEKLVSIGDYYLRRSLYDSSIIYYEMVENQYADTRWAPTALRDIMKAYEKIGYDDLVAETRKKILDTYPNSPEAREVQTLQVDTTATASSGTGGGQ